MLSMEDVFKDTFCHECEEEPQLEYHWNNPQDDYFQCPICKKKWAAGDFIDQVEECRNA